MNTFQTAKGKATVILIIALLTLTLSACGNPSAGSTDGDSLSEASNTTVPEQSASEIKNPAEGADATDAGTQGTEPSDNSDMDLDENGMINVNITVGNEVFAAKFYDNESARTIVSEMPFTLEMNDYASQEKVTDLDFVLPSVSTETPATINAGDIYLWSGNSLVLFYTTFSNSYSYVPVGYTTDVAGLTEALGRGSVTVNFQIAD